MKTQFITTFTILSFLSSCQQSDNIVVVEKWDNGNPKITMNFKSIEDSCYTKTEYFENGNIKSTQDFVNAKLNGKTITYSQTGIKEQEFDYIDGERNGIGTSWYESGKIAFQFKFKDGLYYDGTEYFENGWPRMLVKYSAPGIREGKALYFEEDGHIWQEGYFKNGKEDSLWTTFDKNGMIIKTVKYINGTKVSEENHSEIRN